MRAPSEKRNDDKSASSCSGVADRAYLGKPQSKEKILLHTVYMPEFLRGDAFTMPPGPPPQNTVASKTKPILLVPPPPALCGPCSDSQLHPPSKQRKLPSNRSCRTDTRTLSGALLIPRARPLTFATIISQKLPPKNYLPKLLTGSCGHRRSLSVPVWPPLLRRRRTPVSAARIAPLDLGAKVPPTSSDVHDTHGAQQGRTE